MPPISNKSVHEMLENIPDFIEWDKALQWLEEGQKLVKQSLPAKLLKKEIVSLEWSQIGQKSALPFGLYASQVWRKFVLAVFLADCVSYTQPVDRVAFERLLFVMHAFPGGFRTWWTKLTDGKWWPVGYSGWYPMLETAFEMFEKNPQKLKDRMVVPCGGAEREGGYLYLFNYSVPTEFKGTILPKMLITKFAEEIEAQHPAGLACITVSEDGVRVAKRFGMSHAGDFIVDGCIEGVFTARTNSE